MATDAPAAASAFAIAAPMPREAPVTSATLPERGFVAAIAKRQSGKRANRFTPSQSQGGHFGARSDVISNSYAINTR